MQARTLGRHRAFYTGAANSPPDRLSTDDGVIVLVGAAVRSVSLPSAVPCCLLLGADRVVAIDAVPERKAMAKAAGAEVLDYQHDDIYDRIQDMTYSRGADACIDAVGTEPHTTASFDSIIDRVKVATFLGTDRPHVLRQAIHCCRNFGTVSIVGVYGGFLDKALWLCHQSRLDLPHGTDAGAALSPQADETHRSG